MRDEIPTNNPTEPESAIVNLDSTDGQGGTHWTTYWINDGAVYYFDSYGNLEPTLEWKQYFGRRCRDVYYNTNKLQTYNSIICGHLCFLFLWSISENYKNVRPRREHGQ